MIEESVHLELFQINPSVPLITSCMQWRKPILYRIWCSLLAAIKYYIDHIWLSLSLSFYLLKYFFGSFVFLSFCHLLLKFKVDLGIGLENTHLPATFSYECSNLFKTFISSGDHLGSTRAIRKPYWWQSSQIYYPTVEVDWRFWYLLRNRDQTNNKKISSSIDI